MGEDNSRPQPGDLIKIDRPLYQHWSVYGGDGYVIHVTGKACVTWEGDGCKANPVWAAAKVKKELLTKVAGNHKWRVNKYDRSRTPRPVKEIVRRAEQWIDREVPYGVFDRNCEHFVTELRYGEAASDQV
ncbi:PA216 protein, partial [Sylvietta virens]|nr:PA216 protein [Sylvietta virens]